MPPLWVFLYLKIITKMKMECPKSLEDKGRAEIRNKEKVERKKEHHERSKKKGEGRKRNEEMKKRGKLMNDKPKKEI